MQIAKLSSNKIPVINFRVLTQVDPDNGHRTVVCMCVCIISQNIFDKSTPIRRARKAKVFTTRPIRQSFYRGRIAFRKTLKFYAISDCLVYDPSIDSDNRRNCVATTKKRKYSTLFTISGREKNNNRKIHMHTPTPTKQMQLPYR